MTGELALDDLYGQALEGWRLGARLCVDCGRYHQLRGVIRATKIVNGPDTDRAMLGPLLDEALAPGARVLIAGAGDPGQLQLLDSLPAPRPLFVEVVDLCPTPLALIEQLRPLAGITVTTRQADLTEYVASAPMDLILSHSMLPFVPRPGQLKILERFRAALAADGKLILVTPVSPRQSDSEREAYDAAWIEKVRTAIAQSPPLSELAGDELDAVLAEYAPLRSIRNEGFIHPDEVRALLHEAGLKIVRQVVGGDSLTAKSLGLDKRKHGFLVARA